MADPSPVLSNQGNGSEYYYTDDPLCGCTIVDKDHEATITMGLANYFELLHCQVCCWAELICFYLLELNVTIFKVGPRRDSAPTIRKTWRVAVSEPQGRRVHFS
jgi:hypothetical protein